MATTRLQLFQDIAAELGDLIQLTQSGTGSTTTVFVADEDMVFADGSLNGREAYYATTDETSADNQGLRRIVWDTSQDDTAITVSPAWPATPATGDVLLLVNSRGTGVSIPEIFSKIDQLVRRVSSQLATEVADTPATFDASAPVLEIPTTWRYILGAQVEMGASGSEDWHPLLGNALYVQKWDRTATVKAQYRTLCHNKRVRLIGAIPLTELVAGIDEDEEPYTADEATTWVPSSWLAKLAAAELLEAAYKRSENVANALTYGELVKAQSVQLEGRIKKRWSAVGQRIDLEI